MKKLDALRRAIAAALPDLPRDPERLLLFADDGHIVATSSRSPAFEYRYVGRIVIFGFAGDTDCLMAAVVNWAHSHQPDLFQNPDNRPHGLTFEADVLDEQACDLSIRIKLTESVAAQAAANGAWHLQRIDDSLPGNLDWDPMSWVNARDAADGAVPRT
ncbi:phage tail protein [Burkholderia gladioli]|uniref:phage tail protein n=1 Tax=Burkholderia gladioli TaxID=28095 RepID=UPI001640F42C|nr:phage tail protein [Burkholderia gladioli]